MKEHNLKLDIQYFEEAIWSKKTFEIRFNDREFMEVVEFCDAHCDDGHFDKEGAIANIKSIFNIKSE